MKMGKWVGMGFFAALAMQVAGTVARGADAEGTAAGAKAGTVGAVAVESTTSTATVKAIDHATRTVTLRLADGTDETVHVGKEAVNFERIKVGDEVKATVIESLAVFTRKPGTGAEANGSHTAVALSPKGATPGGMIVDTEEVTATVVAVDHDERLVTLEGKGRQYHTMHVGPNIDLSAVKKGDEVVFRYTQAMALRVELAGGGESEQVASSPVRGAIAVRTVTTDATVTAIDKDQRRLTLKRPDGSEQAFEADKRLTNFDHLKVGDEVKATLAHAVAIGVRKAGTEAEQAKDSEVALAPAGTSGAPFMARTIEKTFTIDAIDAEERMVTLEGEDGHSHIVHVGPRIDLDKLTTGDHVIVRSTPGVLVAVEMEK